MNEDALKQLFAKYMTIPDDVDWSAVRYQEAEGWDSITHMALVGEMEDELGIMLDVDDVIDMSSFDRVVEILSRYGQTVDA